jgi:GDPmannose 4,6-dehydratase
MTKTALVTGCTGQDGSYLCELLLAKGYKVFGLVRRSSTPNTSRIEHILPDITLINGDLLDQSSLMEAIGRAHPDEVYNLAALSHVGISFSQPVATMEVTGLGCTRMLEAIRIVNPYIKFYQASSSEIIGQEDQGHFKPRSPYAASKLYAHWSTANYRDGYGMFACSGILYNHESPRRGLEFVTRKITNGVARIKYGLQESIKLGNLNAYRDWGFAGDYVQAMWLMLQQDAPKDYVIATGHTNSIGAFAAKACELAGLPLPWHNYIDIDETLIRPNDVDCLVGDSTLARQELGWEPTVTFSELVAMMIQSDLALVRSSNEYINREDLRTFRSRDTVRRSTVRDSSVA